MSIAKKSLFLSLPLFALSLWTCCAQVTSGPLNIPFGIDTPVFDITGDYALTQSVVGQGGALTDLSFGVSINNSPSGGLSGSGQTLVSIADGSFAPFAANYVVRGKISGGGTNNIRVTFVVQLSGRDTVVGNPNTPIHITVSYNLIIDTSGLALNGTVRGSLKLGNNSARINSTVGPIPLPQGVDGTWTLQMSIVALNRLSGSGVITVGTVVNANAGTVGRVLDTGLTGSYSATSNLARVALVGRNGARGSTLNLTFFPDGTVNSMRGTILGQRVTILAAQ